MSGEFRIADTALQEVLEKAEQDKSMSRDAMLDALLNSIIKTMLETQRPEHVLSRIEYLANTQNNDEVVVTRGC